ncbi:MAG: glycosyltransferase, partial [Lachnospiraceae bacterium]
DTIQVIHQTNQGLNAAWKAGVRRAGGTYVGFVDSDDFIEPQMYERLYEKALTTEADIVCCGMRHIFEDRDHEPWDDEMLFPKECYTGEELRREVYPVFLNDGSFMGRGLQPNRVSKLLKKKLVIQNMDLCDNGVTVGEDYQFSLAMFLHAEKIAILPHYFPYYYRVNKQSMTGQYDEAYMDKIIHMRHQLQRVSTYQEQASEEAYDFREQITNDFLCLCVLYLKSSVLHFKNSSYACCRTALKQICSSQEVRQALRTYRMPRLTHAERLFLFFMQHQMYACLICAVRLYFR